MAPEKKGLLSMAAGDAPRRSDYHSIETEEGAGGERDAAAQRDAPGDAFAGGQLGAKTLGLWSSIVIVTNNVAGPGMLVLPRVFQEAGWVVPTLVLIFICIGSSLVTLFLIDAMARIPGNSEFQKRIEFVNVFEHYWGKKGMALAQTLFLVNMLAQIVSSIVSNAQVMDGFIIFANPWHTTYALQLYPDVSFVSWAPPTNLLAGMQKLNQTDDSVEAGWMSGMSLSSAAVCHLNNKVTPFDDGPGSDAKVLITAGYLSLAVILIPMSLMNLEENITIQKVSFYMLVLFSLEFFAQFWVEGLSAHTVPAFGENYSHVLGSIIFNYAFVVIIPSWVNEKRPEVSVHKTVWISTIFATTLYIVTGWMGAMAYASATGNILTTLSNACSPNVTRVSAFLFAFGMIGLGIPFMSIVVRYSLLVGRVCTPQWSQFWAVFFPWMGSWLFYQGGLFNELIAWSGDLAIGPVNFVLPLMLTLTALGVSGMVPRSWTSRAADPETHKDFSFPRDRNPSCSEMVGDAFQAGDGSSFSDPANTRTAAEPLPQELQRYHRPIAAVLCILLLLIIITSIATHTHHYVTARSLSHAINYFETAR